MTTRQQYARPARGWEAKHARELAQQLRRHIRGEVRFDSGTRAMYATDASNYRQVPIGVVVPRDIDDVVEAVSIAREFAAPLLMRGGGTSLAGQTCNVAVVLDTSRHLNRVLSVDPDRRIADVEPGVVCDVLRNAAQGHGLTFGPDPATHSRCTLGGMIGNNSCGAHSVMAGKTDENVESLRILTVDGTQMTVGVTTQDALDEIIRGGGRAGEIHAGLRALRDRYADAIRAGFPRIRRRVSGYNLDALLPENGFNVARALVGTEGTCAITLGATVRLVPSPPYRVLVVLGYADIALAGDAAPAILEGGPLCIEGLDEQIIDDMRKKGMSLAAIDRLPAGSAWLLVEYGGESLAEATDRARDGAARAADIVHRRAAAVDSRIYTDVREQGAIWTLRSNGAAATNSVPGEPETYPGWEDAAVDPAYVGDYLRDFRRLLDRYGYKSSLYGHFGDGCIHGRMTFDLTSREGVVTWRRFLEEATDLVVRYGGSLSGEHGDGQARAELLPRMYSPEIMAAFRDFKRIWDPDNRLNPGKLVDPRRLDQDLRTGPDYRPAEPATVFSFARDEGKFSRAANRCVGAGVCRRHEGGTMCPSYRATGEERYSTRGRSRLLFEMLQGDPLKDGWDNEAVRESLDLCLSCKGCRHECPTQVDMATYKAEFLSHYHEHHRRPLRAYTMGWFHRWAPLAGKVPWLANLLAGSAMGSALVRRVAHIAPERKLPRFASRPFTRTFSSNLNIDARTVVDTDVGRKEPVGSSPSNAATFGAESAVLRQVMLWPDTFNNFIHADVAKAAVAVLRACGFTVLVPSRRVCCGRPLYDWGMLDQARRTLSDTLDALAPAIEANIPVVGLEPSCMGTFRDELPNLFPEDERARWLSSNTWLLPDFLVEHVQEPVLPRMAGQVLVHAHCHQRALFGIEGTRRLLERMGLDVTVLDSGCCGMAGAFGYDRDKYEISLRIGEETLLPAVRSADPEVWIVSDGYSCREQVEQTTGRKVLHTAELLQHAFDSNS